jgi:hypothetical protein
MKQGVRQTIDWVGASRWRVAAVVALAVVFLAGARTITSLLSLALLVGILWAGVRWGPSLLVAIPPRWATGVAAVATLLAGYAIVRIPPDSSDNAWLIVLPPIWWLGLSTLGFVVATLIPGRWHRGAAGAALVVFVIFGGLSLLFLVPSAINANEQDLLGNDFRGPVRIVTAVAVAVFAAIPIWLFAATTLPRVTREGEPR